MESTQLDSTVVKPLEDSSEIIDSTRLNSWLNLLHVLCPSISGSVYIRKHLVAFTKFYTKAIRIR